MPGAVVPMAGRQAPQRGAPLMANGVLGMMLFVFTETMLFAGMISAHAIVRSGAPGQAWPPAGQPRLPLQATLVTTVALLVSGRLLLAAHAAYKREPAQALRPMLWALLLGSFFVVFQGVEWVRLIGEGLTLSSSAYGGFFYLIIGTHAAHAVAAILGLGWAYRRLHEGRLTAAQLHTVETFWYFVVLVWPVLYLKVYL